MLDTVHGFCHRESESVFLQKFIKERRIHPDIRSYGIRHCIGHTGLRQIFCNARIAVFSSAWSLTSEPMEYGMAFVTSFAVLQPKV